MKADDYELSVDGKRVRLREDTCTNEQNSFESFENL